MSPRRPTSRGSSISKPYTRSPSSIPLPTGNPSHIAHAEYPQTPTLDESDGLPGFPTRAQYQVIEKGYIDSLTPRRQGKALISQALFDRIWDVLHSTDNVKENAQFRFWARKMFTLSKSHVVSFGSEGPHRMDQEVLLHDGLLVAVREQIYDLLCYCHGSTGHGGRDKTCALIRKHYTWVPKDLVAQFVKACPTCVMKKCGHSDIELLSSRSGSAPAVSPVTPATSSFGGESRRQETSPSRLSFSDYFYLDALDGLTRETSVSLPSTPLPAPHSQFMFDSGHSDGTPIDELLRYNESSSNDVSQGFPMVREVSLYRGLPNGWQYQNVDYESAHAELVNYQRMAPIMPYDPSLGRTRPRIPDVAPLFRPHFEDFINHEVEESEIILGSQDENYTNESLAYPQPHGLDAPIDPFLLALASSINSHALDYESPRSSPRRFPLSNSLDGEGDVCLPPPSSISSSPTPDHRTDHSNGIGLGNSVGLTIDYLDSVETFQDLYTIRESMSGKNSPASSTGSDASGQSLVSGVVLRYGNLSPTSVSSTPATSAPVTPIDEVPAVKKDGMVLHGVTDRSGEESEDLKAVIEGVSVCGVRA